MIGSTIKPAINEPAYNAPNTLFVIGGEVKKRFVENLLGFSDDVTDYTQEADLLRVMRQVPDVMHSAGKVMSNIYGTGKFITEGLMSAPPIIGKLVKNKGTVFSNELLEYVHKAENASSSKEAFQVMSEWGKKFGKGKLMQTAFSVPAGIAAFHYAAPLFAAIPLLSYISAILGGGSMGMALGQVAQVLYKSLSGKKIESAINTENSKITNEENKIREALIAAGGGKLTEELQQHLTKENLETANISRIQLNMAVNKYTGIQEGVKYGGTVGGALAGGLLSSSDLLKAIKSTVTGGNVIPSSHPYLSSTGLAVFSGKAGAVAGTLTLEALAGIAGIALYLVHNMLQEKTTNGGAQNQEKLHHLTDMNQKLQRDADSYIKLSEEIQKIMEGSAKVNGENQ